MRRQSKHKKGSGDLFNITNLIGIGVLAVIIGSMLLYDFNKKQQSKIMTTYCGEFGFYGKKTNSF